MLSLQARRSISTKVPDKRVLAHNLNNLKLRIALLGLDKRQDYTTVMVRSLPNMKRSPFCFYAQEPKYLYSDEQYMACTEYT